MTQTETELPRRGPITWFLVFLGGALVGGTTALLLAPRSGAETRRRLAGAAEDSREVASRLPAAIRQATGAARTAFSAALKASEGEDGVATSAHHS